MTLRQPESPAMLPPGQGSNPAALPNCGAQPLVPPNQGARTVSMGNLEYQHMVPTPHLSALLPLAAEPTLQPCLIAKHSSAQAKNPASNLTSCRA